MNKSLAVACKTSMDSLYSYLSREWYTFGSQSVQTGELVLLGHRLWRGCTLAAKRLTTSAIDGALFICPRREATAGGQA